MLPWVEAPTLTLDWSRPVEERYAQVPADVVAKGRVLLAELKALAPRGVRLLGDVVRLRTGGRFQREAVALAAALGESWRTVLVANVTYDLALAMHGCSTVVLATPSGPVLARNMDWWPERPLAQTSYLIRAERGGELVFANAGWPGAIGVVSGLSARGFGITLNAVQAPGGVDKLGYPVLLHLRRVLEDANDFRDAVERLTHERLAAGCLLTVVGRENDQRVVIERTPRKHLIRWPDGDGPLMVTNHYRGLYEKLTGATADPAALLCTRYDALHGLFQHATADDAYDDARLLYALSDERVMQDITAQHVIIRPRDDTIRLLVPRRLIEDAA